MFRLISVLILTMSLFSCTSSIVQQKASNNDWLALGEYDASNGFIEKSEEKLQVISNQYTKEKVDYGAYLVGYERALNLYCKPQNAYILGIKGMPYHHVCERYPRGWAFYQDWISGRKSRAGSIFN